jgi:DedD protein
MRGAFDDEYLEQRKSSGDAEITLGAGTLLLISAGLVVLCGVCFGLGYIVGHHGATPQTAVQQIDSTRANTQASSSLKKPSATAQEAGTVLSQPTVQPTDQSQSASNDQPQPSIGAQGPASSAGQPQVHPALPPAAASQQPSTAYSSRSPTSQAQPQVRSATAPQAATLWVQIAAVSHVEDAQVLTTALRKRGYAVTPRRESDNLIHVRVGPFNSNNEANRWRVKLLDDGYNAEIQQ